jgi:hypothetical protein
MAVYDIFVPEPSDIDHTADLRQRRYDDMKRRLKWDDIRLKWLEQACLSWLTPGHPLHELVADLQDAPLEDRWDLDGFIKHLPTRTKARIGEALIKCLGEVQIMHAQGDDVMF